MAEAWISAPRAALDGALYDLDLITARERARLREIRPVGGDILVAHPRGRRMIGRYESVADFAISIDALTRVISVTGPGTSTLGVVAFARAVADSLGEPVLTVLPTYDVEDLFRDLGMSFFVTGGWGPRRSVESAELAQLLLDPRFRFQLLVAHSTGAWTMSEALFAAREGNRCQPNLGAAPRRRALSLGAAVPTPTEIDATHLVGAADPVGWLLSDPAETVDLSPPGAGHHLNPQIPGALDLSSVLASVDMAAHSGRRPGRGAGPTVARLHD